MFILDEEAIELLIFNVADLELQKGLFEGTPERKWIKIRDEENHLWPKGFNLEVSKLDLRPGGIFFYSQRSSEEQVTWGKFVYQEIKAPEKLVFIQSFSAEPLSSS